MGGRAEAARPVRGLLTARRPLGIIDFMPLIETEEAARRLARAIASDLSLYNEDKIVSGVQNDNLFESLAEEIEEGRALYKRRVSPDLYPRNFYDRALVDILVKAKGHVKSKLW
jgi:hypothetical protein